MESEQLYVWYYAVFYEITGIYNFLLTMALAHYARQWNMRTNGAILARTQETQGEVVDGKSTTTQPHQQRRTAMIFSPITPIHVTSQSRVTQVG